MSLILDALRKMEQERKARQGAAQNLRPEVLRYRSRIEPKRGRLPVMVSLFLVAVAVGAASFYIGKRDAGKYQLQSALPGAGVPSTSSVPPAPVSSVEAGGAPSQQPSLVPPPAAGPVPASAPSAGTTAAAGGAPSVTRGADTVDSFIPLSSTSRTRRRATAGVNRSSATELQAERAAAAKQGGAEIQVQEARARRREATEVEQAAPADISVSGIAFQDERHLRRAVINGTLVGKVRK